MGERGVEVDQSTINLRVFKYAPEFNKRIHAYLRFTKDFWRVEMFVSGSRFRRAN